MIDQRYKNQLLITDNSNYAVRTVDVMSKDVGTFVESDSLVYIAGITKDEKSGDLYVIEDNAVYRLAYIQRTVSLMSGSTGKNSASSRDSTLLNSLFDWPDQLIFITLHTLLVAARMITNSDCYA